MQAGAVCFSRALGAREPPFQLLFSKTLPFSDPKWWDSRARRHVEFQAVSMLLSAESKRPKRAVQAEGPPRGGQGLLRALCLLTKALGPLSGAPQQCTWGHYLGQGSRPTSPGVLQGH